MNDLLRTAFTCLTVSILLISCENGSDKDQIIPTDNNHQDTLMIVDSIDTDTLIDSDSLIPITADKRIEINHRQ